MFIKLVINHQGDELKTNRERRDKICYLFYFL